MNTIERLIAGITPLPWRAKMTTHNGNQMDSIVSDDVTLIIADVFCDCQKLRQAGRCNRDYLVKMANSGPRLVEFVSRFAESFGQVESQLDSPELEMLQDARTLLKDLLGDDDDAKRAYMQRSMRETRKK